MRFSRMRFDGADSDIAYSDNADLMHTSATKRQTAPEPPQKLAIKNRTDVIASPFSKTNVSRKHDDSHDDLHCDSPYNCPEPQKPI